MKRELPKITVHDSEGKRKLSGQELIEMLFFHYCSNGYNRTYLAKKLPLDVLGEFIDRYARYKEHLNQHKKKFNVNQDYYNYIHSKEWRKLRKEVLSRRNKCEHCDVSGVELHLHHLTYDNFKHETDVDLAVLCSNCHSAVHGRRIGGSH